MIIAAAGINHFDPRCRSLAIEWLRGQVNDRASQPAFVANEWTEQLSREVLAARPRFRELLLKQWPDASIELLTILEQSLAYEADTHLPVCPHAEVLWLGRDGPKPLGMPSYPVERVWLYRNFLGEGSMPASTERFITLIGEAARARANADLEPQRERDMARAIMDRVGRGGGTWAALVVGSAHLAEDGGSLASLLRSGGCVCEITIL